MIPTTLIVYQEIKKIYLTAYLKDTKKRRSTKFNLLRKQPLQDLIDVTTTHSHATCSIHLPTELVCVVFTFLDALDLTVVTLVSHSWNSIALDSSLWKLKGCQDTEMQFILSKTDYKKWLLEANPIVFEEISRRWMMRSFVDAGIVHEQIWCCERPGFQHPCQKINQWVKDMMAGTEVLHVVHFISHGSYTYKLADGRVLAVWIDDNNDDNDDNDEKTVWHCVCADTWQNAVIQMPVYKTALNSRWNKCVYKLKHRRTCKWLAGVYKAYLQAHPHIIPLGLSKKAQIMPFPFL